MTAIAKMASSTAWRCLADRVMTTYNGSGTSPAQAGSKRCDVGDRLLPRVRRIRAGSGGKGVVGIFLPDLEIGDDAAHVMYDISAYYLSRCSSALRWRIPVTAEVARCPDCSGAVLLRLPFWLAWRTATFCGAGTYSANFNPL